jgi:glutamine synthetase adenylyltransferase
MGFDSWEIYRQVLDGHRRRVRAHFDRLLETDTENATRGNGNSQTPVLADAWSSSVSGE